MFSHVMIGARDVPLLVAFYDRVLAPLGLERTTPLDDIGPAGVIWQVPGARWPQFAFRAPIDGRPAAPGNGVQIGFRCPSRTAVRSAWEAALRHGGRDEGAPGDRPIYDADFYAAYARDPEGNKLCFLHCAEFGKPPG